MIPDIEGNDEDNERRRKVQERLRQEEAEAQRIREEEERMRKQMRQKQGFIHEEESTTTANDDADQASQAIPGRGVGRLQLDKFGAFQGKRSEDEEQKHKMEARRKLEEEEAKRIEEEEERMRKQMLAKLAASEGNTAATTVDVVDGYGGSRRQSAVSVESESSGSRVSWSSKEAARSVLEQRKLLENKCNIVEQERQQEIARKKAKAEKAGKEFNPDSVTEPNVVYQLSPTGVEIIDNNVEK